MIIISSLYTVINHYTSHWLLEEPVYGSVRKWDLPVTLPFNSENDEPEALGVYLQTTP